MYTEAAMISKEEELNATISKLEANISSLKESLKNEESEKLVRLLILELCSIFSLLTLFCNL